MDLQEAVQEYQCPGCVSGPYPDCYKPSGTGCSVHCAGTMGSGIGSFFLGMPKGFCRIGPIDKKYFEIVIMGSPSEYSGYDKFNVPVWKYLDNNGNTIVKGLSPRINQIFLHVFLGDFRTEINSLEITQQDVDDMD